RRVRARVPFPSSRPPVRVCPTADVLATRAARINGNPGRTRPAGRRRPTPAAGRPGSAHGADRTGCAAGRPRLPDPLRRCRLRARRAGPLRTDTINEIKNFLPALAWLNAGAANLLGGFQTDLATEAALNPPAAPLLAPLVAWTGGGQVRAQATAAGADVLGVT